MIAFLDAFAIWLAIGAFYAGFTAGIITAAFGHDFGHRHLREAHYYEKIKDEALTEGDVPPDYEAPF